MSLVVRVFFTVYSLMFWFPVQARDIYILVVGESMSSNCNSHRFDKVPGVYQIGLSGQEEPAFDPFEWADCDQGSMWMPLGSEIIRSKLADKVVFMPIGMSSTKVADWLQGGIAYDKLQSALKIAKKRGIKFDYAFWLQGYSNIGSNKNKYAADLSTILKSVSRNIRVGKWIIARQSGCFSSADRDISNVQRLFGHNYVFNRYEGPDSNAIENKYRFSGCDLNKEGQEEMAKLWLSSIMKAERNGAIYQKESLLQFFR
jgi:hypothetical protein